MNEGLFQGLTALFVLAAAAALAVEWRLAGDLHPAWLGPGGHTADRPTDFPRVDPTKLDGLAGSTAHATYRWDPALKALLFRRAATVIPGQRGVMTGTIRFTPDGTADIRFRPAPVTILPLFFGFGCLGAVGLIAVEDAPIAVLGAPLLILPVLAFSWWIQVQNAQETLAAVILPELAEVLAGRA